jgi:regulator of Ty1 transposition protein 109
MASSFHEDLTARLKSALPKDLRFTIHHVHSRPTTCDPIFSPPQGETPEQTHCESHFLSVSVDVTGLQTQAFAVEVLIYETESLTTLFISKADSTGYLHYLNIAKGTPSPIRTVISISLKLLVQTKRRSGVRLIVSLFARAQDQYLFPYSIENSKKHVLDDRGLIRWWCKIVDIILHECPGGIPPANESLKPVWENEQFISCGYLRVPGCDIHETKAFFPRRDSARLAPTPRWLPSDPLRALGKPATSPERCLIPRFPDDPKARFVIDLDDELEPNESQVEASPIKRPPGKWRSIRNLEEFWEMMAFRQECAAGRLVGFIWGVFTPVALVERPFSVLENGINEDHSDEANSTEDALLPTPASSQRQIDTLVDRPSKVINKSIEMDHSEEVKSAEDPPLPTPASSQAHDNTTAKDLPPIRSSSPQALVLSPLPSSQLQSPDSQQDTSTPSQEESSAHVMLDFNTKRTAAAIELTQPAYTRTIDMLRELDYGSQSLAAESTQKWVAAVAKEAGVHNWGIEIIGLKETPVSPPHTNGISEGTRSPLDLTSTGLKRKSEEDAGKAANGVEGVKILSAGLVRKKPKVRAQG